MKQMSHDICTDEGRGDHMASGLDVPSIQVKRWCRGLGNFWIALVAISLFLWISPASAHEDIDPEIEELTEKLAKKPDDVELLRARAWNYRKNREFRKSLDDVDRAALLDPENDEILLERGLALSALKRDEEAEVVLNHFLEKGEAKRRQDKDEEDNDGEKEESEKRKGRENTTPGRLTDRTSDENDLLTALVERAFVLARLNKADLSLNDFTAAIKIRPSMDLYLSRGRLEETLGQFDKAAKGYREGLTRVGNALHLKKSLIRVETERHRYRKVLRLIDEELDRAPVKTSWYLRRAEILDVMGKIKASQKAKNKALTEANRVLKKRTTALNRLARGKVYMALGQRPEARRDLELAVQMAPNLEEARGLLGVLKGQGE